MNKASRTYSHFSAFTLMLFLISIVLPVTLSAASLLCDMDMSQMNHDTHACCNLHGNDVHDETTISSNKAPCNYMELCEQAITKDQNNVEAIPQLSKSFVAAFIFTSIFPADAAVARHRPAQSEAPAPEKNQPIFLLNSAFLN